MVELAATLFVILVLAPIIFFVGCWVLIGVGLGMEKVSNIIASEKHVLGWVAIVGIGLIVIAMLTSAARQNITTPMKGTYHAKAQTIPASYSLLAHQGGI
jgi:hypothetical protein